MRDFRFKIRYKIQIYLKMRSRIQRILNIIYSIERYSKTTFVLTYPGEGGSHEAGCDDKDLQCHCHREDMYGKVALYY